MELQLIKNEVQRIILQASTLEFEYDGKCLLPGSTNLITITSPDDCHSSRSQHGLSCRFIEIFDRLSCVAEFLALPPFHIAADPTLAQSIETALTAVVRRCMGASALPAPADQATAEVRLDVTHRDAVGELPVLHFVGRHLGNYGHLLLDNLFRLTTQHPTTATPADLAAARLASLLAILYINI